MTYNIKVIAYIFKIITFYSFRLITYNLKMNTYDLKVINQRNELITWICLMVRQSHTRRVGMNTKPLLGNTNSCIRRSHRETCLIFGLHSPRIETLA